MSQITTTEDVEEYLDRALRLLQSGAAELYDIPKRPEHVPVTRKEFNELRDAVAAIGGGATCAAAAVNAYLGLGEKK